MLIQKTPEGRFMVAVGAIIVNSATQKILLLKRSKNLSFRPNVWEYPIGRMKQFEELEEALQREIQEETGITQVTIGKPISVFHFFRGEKTAEKEIVGIVYTCTTQTDQVTISAEHDVYQWVSQKEVLDFVEEPWMKRDFTLFLEKS